VDTINNKGMSKKYSGFALQQFKLYQEAIQYYDRALIIDPKCLQAINNKGYN
jgi:tetratricopeptide (TPR) repeat protein